MENIYMKVIEIHLLIYLMHWYFSMIFNVIFPFSFFILGENELMECAIIKVFSYRQTNYLTLFLNLQLPLFGYVWNNLSYYLPDLLYMKECFIFQIWSDIIIKPLPSRTPWQVADFFVTSPSLRTTNIETNGNSNSQPFLPHPLALEVTLSCAPFFSRPSFASEFKKFIVPI